MAKRMWRPESFRDCPFCHGKGVVPCTECRNGYLEIRRTDSSGHSYVEREKHTACDRQGKRICTPCGGTGDQPTYNKLHPEGVAPGVELPVDDSTELDDPVALNQSPADLVAELLENVERHRTEIIDRICRADSLTEREKTQYVKDLQVLNLDDPSAETAVQTIADQLAGSAGDAGALSMTVNRLALSCGSLATYRRMSK